METRAHHTLIGAFILIFIMIGIAFSLWIGKYQFDRRFAFYDIVFPEAVTGLNVSSDVRYQGIPIGEVARISIDPNEPDKVRVTIRIEQRDDIQILNTTTGSLEILGITGGAFVQLANPVRDGEQLPIVFDPLAEHPVIAYQPSSLQSLFTDLPRLIKTADGLLNDARALLDPQNRERIGLILGDIQQLTATIADNKDQVERILANTADLTGEATQLAKEATMLAQDIEALLDERGDILEQIGGAAESFDVLARDVSRILRENEEEINAFASQGLAQAALFVSDARRLVVRLERFTRRLEADPSGFLFGGSTPVEVKRKE